MASLDLSKLESIVSLLSEDTIKQTTLEDFLKAAQKRFTRSEHFKVCSVVSVLLQHADLLPDPCQRLAAITMLHQLPRLEAAQSSPFIVQLHQLLGNFNDNSSKSQNKQKPQTLPDKLQETSLLTDTEKKFIVLLLSDINIRELLKRRPGQIISSLEGGSLGSSLSVEPCPALRAAESLPAMARAGVSLLLPHPQPSTGSQQAGDASASNTLRDVVQRGGVDLVRPYTPAFLRPAPPVYQTLNELVWLRNSQLESEEQVAYDASLCVTNEGDAEARRLMTRAFKETLSIPQLQQLLAHLEREPRLGYKTGLTPQKLPVLVEHNPLIAIEFLLRVMQTSQITDYLNVLVNMEMSLHSMEVVNRLTTTVELPPEFVHLYITNCIATCESIKDRYMQNRLVRLVCVFLQSLIRNKIINVQQLFVEVQAFCIEFSRIREAAALFKLLKQLDAGDGGGGPATTPGVVPATTTGGSGTTPGGGSGTTPGGGSATTPGGGSGTAPGGAPSTSSGGPGPASTLGGGPEQTATPVPTTASISATSTAGTTTTTVTPSNVTAASTTTTTTTTTATITATTAAASSEVSSLNNPTEIKK